MFLIFNFWFLVSEQIMAHKKAGKATKRQGTPPCGKRLGVKIFGGQRITPGMIVVRQKGTKFHPGEGMKMGRDFTIFAVRKGIVSFKKKMGDVFVFVE